MKGTLGYKIRTIVCAGCGQPASGHMRPNQRFCSHACYASSSKPWRRTGGAIRCEQCGGIFSVGGARLGQARFCSRGCADAWQGRNKLAYTCKVCGKGFRWSASRAKQANITYCSLVCRDADPDRAARLREMNARQAALRPNGLERLCYTSLDTLGIPYDRQAMIAGKFCVDALFPASRLVVQFDGDYWHGNPARFPDPDARQSRRMKLDRSQDAYLTKAGYRVVRVWESHLKRHSEALLEPVRAALGLKPRSA
jgi:very-short-patch-repair endonuclease